MEDADLLSATAAGDADAFATFYRRHLARVLAYTLKLTADRELAADLTAEVFAVALDRCRRYDPRHPTALPWLMGIANNKLRESRRRGRVQDAVRRRLQIELPALDTGDLDEVTRLAGQGEADLLAAVAALPEPERSAIRARFVTGLGYRAIATELRCSEPAARQRVSRGLARLRARLSTPEENRS